MEPTEIISEGEYWSSLSGLSTAEEVDFMAQLLGNFSVPNEPYGSSSLVTPSAFWPGHESTGTNQIPHPHSSSNSNANVFCFSQGSGHSASCGGPFHLFPASSDGHYSCDSQQVLMTNNGSLSADIGYGDAKITSPYMANEHDLQTQQIDLGNAKGSGLNQPGKEVLEEAKRELEMQVSNSVIDNKRSNSLENSTKRSRSTIEVPENTRNVKLNRNSKVTSSTSNNNVEERSSSSYSSEDESNASQGLNRGETSSSLSPKGPSALNLSGKPRASRGSATDPQSLYARKRRERINERLRILQNLVPNGTKVDISTMLEEAVQYVKFLQLQIKLLSSDDLWMYAPIAYNGKNIGLDLNMTPPKQ